MFESRGKESGIQIFKFDFVRYDDIPKIDASMSTQSVISRYNVFFDSTRHHQLMAKWLEAMCLLAGKNNLLNKSDLLEKCICKLVTGRLIKEKEQLSANGT